MPSKAVWETRLDGGAFSRERLVRVCHAAGAIHGPAPAGLAARGTGSGLAAGVQAGVGMHLPEPLLQEIVRLGERALCPHQERWPYRTQARKICFKPDHWKDSEIRDLLWLEDELSGCLLDVYEKCRPGALERQATNLIWQARKTA